ncbi:cytochrome P450, partial [Cryphonectria parasitica EP155]
YLVARCVYLLYFHPLARYPGPKLAALSEAWHNRNMTCGRGCFNVRELHHKHGDVVRLGPNRLSFATPQAYRDIYGHVKHGQDRFLKNKWYELDEPRIVRVRDPIAHAEQRRALSHAFSARALRDQESVIHRYVDLLMEQLARLGNGGEKPPFEAVSQGSNRWINLIIRYLQHSFYRRNAKKYGPFSSLYMQWSSSSELREASEEHRTLTSEKAKRRLELGDMGRVDFFSHLLKGGKLDERSIIGNTDTLIIAGSETTATTLCGLTWYLLSHPACLQKLTDEVRGAFQSLDEITGDSTATLPYLHGCIEEGLRMFPPVTIGLPRDCPGAVIDGRYIPKDTIVQCDPLTLHTSPRYWVDSEEYRPERWLGAGLEGDDKRAFQPFSTGPRACLGVNMAYMELRIALAKLMWTYDMEMASKIDNWYDACVDVGLWKKPDLMVKFHPRVVVQ